MPRFRPLQRVARPRFATVLATLVGAWLAFPGAEAAWAAGGTSVPAGGRSSAGGPSLLLPNANERRAVRGRPPPEPAESHEQAIIRRFEESLPEVLPDAAAPTARPVSAPPGKSGDLGGTWHGTGEEVPTAAAAPEPSAEGEPAAVSATGLTATYLAFFTSDAGGKAVAAAWLDRLAAWKDPCERVLEAAGVPAENLLAAVASSGFDVEARTRAGELGPWLLARDEARAHGLKVGFWLDERRDPVRATEAAARLLKPLYDRFGSWPMALVALHLGTSVAQAEAGRGADPKVQSRPARLYLARLAALVQLASRREEHAGAKNEGTGDPFVIIEAPMATTLETVAQVTGVDVLALRTLNPALLRDRVAPVPGPTLRVPVGTRPVTQAAFDAALGPSDRVRIESLRLGESAEALALANKVLPAEMKRLHGVRDLGELRGPMEVLLPVAQEVESTGSPDGAARAAAAHTAVEVPEELPLVAVPARHFDLPDRARRFYFVVEGDTIEEIAAAAEITPAEILAWNNLDPIARLQPKMILQLYVRPDLDQARIALVEPAAVRAVEVGSEQFHALEVAGRGKTRLVYDCHAGDTLPKIARRFGLGAPDLARINRISASSDLSAGQHIVVYAPAGNRPGGRDSAAGRTVNQPSQRRQQAPVAGKAAGSKAAAMIPVRSSKLVVKPAPARPNSSPAPRR
jgi:membrane-bound lytic murein transglycosylase D